MERYQEIEIFRALPLGNSEGSGFRGWIEGHCKTFSEVQGHIVIPLLDLSLQSLLINASFDRWRVFATPHLLLTLLHLFELLVRSLQGLFLFSALAKLCERGNFRGGVKDLVRTRLRVPLHCAPGGLR